MKILKQLLIISVLGLVGCFGSSEQSIIDISSDGCHAKIELIVEAKYGVFIPSPEPPTIKSKTVRLNIHSIGNKDFSVNLGNVYKHAPPRFSIDAKISNDCKYIAAKTAGSVFAYDDKGGEILKYEVPGDELISSIAWSDDNELLVVIKKTLSNWHGEHRKFGYTEKTKSLRLLKFNLATNKYKTSLKAETQPVTFVFNGARFHCQEISPNSKFFTYFNGKTIEVFNINKGAVEHSIDVGSGPRKDSMSAGQDSMKYVEIYGELHGVWWVDENHLILGCDVLRGDPEYFLCSMDDKRIEDVTAFCLPSTVVGT
ncbi:YncE family protein [Desulfatibacillum aliphaticivorans]|uniref:YncE family protein n=1 Tax=Desulfatibacillum aliphaticivorans TaxID=218208 RepID=UPI00041F9B59|nr:hypothetical protein [Desulfatibacillum aliphaticivorans]